MEGPDSGTRSCTLLTVTDGFAPAHPYPEQQKATVIHTVVKPVPHFLAVPGGVIRGHPVKKWLQIVESIQVRHTMAGNTTGEEGSESSE